MTAILRGIKNRSANNTRGIRTYTDTYSVEVTSQSDTAYTAGSASGLPLVGQVHPDDFTAWCTSLDVQLVGGWKWYTVTANYSSEFELSENPLFEPAQITWDFEQFQRPALADRSGDAVLNSAGDYYDPPAMRDDSRPIVSVTKNLSVVPTWILNYQDAINSSAFTVDGIVVAAELAKMNRVGISTVQNRNGIQFRTVTMEIHLQRDGWALSLLDAGYRKKSGTTRVIILSDDGTEPSTPIPLDGSGALLSNPTPTNAVFNSYDVYYTADFNALPLA